MLVVKVELWPFGDPTRAKLLSEMYIGNDVSGTRIEGNYDVKLMSAPGDEGTMCVLDTARVEKFPRHLGALNLVLRALVALGSLALQRATEER